MKKLFLIVTIFIFVGLVSGFEGGDGSSGNPYQISTCQQLQNISSDLSANYEITQNIECQGTDFNPIGDNETGFTGSLDGKQNIIWNLKIDGVAGENVGLIARNEGNLQDIRIQGAEVYGEDMNGGILAAENVGGIINRSMSSGIIKVSFATVNGHGTSVGGLVGKTRGGGIISRSYAVVYADSQVQGGLAGALEDSSTEIRKSYAAGQVTTDGYPSGGGGLVGDIIDGSVRDSYGASDLITPDPNSSDGGLAGVARFGGSVTDGYYDQNISGLDGDDGDSSISGTANPGVNLTTQMITADADVNMNGLDFSNTWQSSSFYYPQLSWQEVGLGTSSDPYMVEDCRQLQAMENDLDAHYRLANDIDCSITEKWNGGKGFDPVGDADNRFSGILNGDGHVIYDLYIDRPSTSYEVGLFGYVASTADTNRVRKIGLERVDITGETDVGGIIGQNDHNREVIRKSYVTGNISGDRPVGALIGTNFGQVLDSYANATVRGNGRVGGLIGNDFVNPLVRTYFIGSSNGNPVAGYEYEDPDNGINATDTYWDVDNTGIESNPGDHGAEPLRTYEMTDIRAVEYMEGFNFSNTWTARDNDRYPELSVFANESGLDPSNPQPPGLPETVYPSNGSEEEVARYLETGLTTRHPESLSMDVNFTSEEGNVYGQASSSDLTVAFSGWTGLDTGTNYEWYTTIEDSNGAVLNTSKWIGNWNFTTLYRPENPSNPYPSNNSQAFPVDENISIDVYQEDDRDLINDLYLTDNLGISKDSFGVNSSKTVAGGDGTAEFGQSNIDYQLENGTTYSWFVNSTFTESVSGEENPTYFNESGVYSFTTYESPEPDQFMPSVGEAGVNPEPSLNVSIGHYDNVTVEFFDAGDDSSLGTAGVQNGWANLSGYNDFDTTGTEFWYINATADSGEKWSNYDNPWNFTVSDVQNLNMNLQTEDRINLNNGSADIGPKQNLEASVSFDGSGEIEIGFEIFNQSDNSIANLTDQVSDGETASVDIRNAGLQQDNNYTWTTFYKEGGTELYERPENRSFTTITVDADWQRQSDDSGEEIDVYYANSCSASFPGDYEKAGSVQLDGVGLSGVTSIAEPGFSEGEISLQLEVSNILGDSNPKGGCETVSIP